ncbi:MAG: alpha/beta hydrolase [Bacteroidetes bacterium]|nr:alpha/beta hydrolase [Bacteroidota bacterium]
MQAPERIAFLESVSCRDIGQGPVVLLLHGFCESHLIFDSLLPQLTSDYRVVAPDLPGHGGTPWDKGIRTMDDFACWLRDLLDALEVEQCVLIGHSMGGYVAAAFAELFPERLRGLGMLHSTALGDAEERKENRTKSMAFVEQNGKELFLRAFVASLFHDPEPRWLMELTDITAPTDTDAIVACLRMMRDRPDRSAIVGALAVPVMYITGGLDGLVSPERSRQELAQLPLALLHRIPEASHMGMYEAPERVIAAVLSLVENAERGI